MKPGLQALGRLKTGQMNKTETAYSLTLADDLHAGRIQWWKFEGVKLRLADNTFYTPDFAVLASDFVLECREIKGSPRIFADDARVKIKVAADLYPFRFIAVYPVAKKAGGGWKVERFS